MLKLTYCFLVPQKESEMSDAAHETSLTVELLALQHEAEALEGVYLQTTETLIQAFRVFDIALSNMGIPLEKLTWDYPYQGVIIDLSVKNRNIRLIYSYDDKLWGVDLYPSELHRFAWIWYVNGELTLSRSVCTRQGLSIDDLITITEDVVRFLGDKLRPDKSGKTPERLSRLQQINRDLTNLSPTSEGE
jgi:hypothetical protein